MRRLLIAVVFMSFTVPAMAGSGGMVTVTSANDVKTTVKQLKKVLKDKGMTIFKTVDHAKGAEEVGLKLRPTTVVIFGNPQVGTLLMQCGQTAGIDLPMKMLVWEDSRGRVHVSYNDPSYLASRHRIKGCAKVKKKMAGAQAAFAKAAAKKAPPKKGLKDYNPFKKDK
ncbi:MAG: DUF302 domain-containing protein [Acidiferrobacterales bacterium]|nr:DUF302 domain-containing protein [Acidiferrobacterales bacterium]